MASTFTTAATASTVPPRSPSAAGLTAVKATYTAATALVVNDVIQMVKVPLGAVIYRVELAVDDLDTGAAIVLAVGDGVVADRYITGSTIGQAGGVVTTNNVAGAGYTYTADDTIDVKVTTAPAGGGTGVIRLSVLFAKE